MKKLAHKMKTIDVYSITEFSKIEQLPLQRDWMDETFDRHASQCFPISLSNRLGWGISFNEDVRFIWDGVVDSDPSAEHVRVLSENNFVHTGRANATISFDTGMTFECKDQDDLSLITMPVPNQFIRGAQCMTTIVSPSALQGEYPIAWRITEPNIEIVIPAGTPIASIFPISLKNVQDYELRLSSEQPSYHNDSWFQKMRERAEVSQQLNKSGKWTNFYRNAVDHNGDSSGKHEVKKIIMGVVDGK
jgi:hypothetical protein